MVMRFWHWILALALVGILLSSYLLFEQWRNDPLSAKCYVNATVNCTAIISGEVAHVLGIPTPLYGLAGYLLIALAAWRRRLGLLFPVALFGLIFCLSIGYIEVFKLGAYCIVCFACQTVMIAVFVLALWLIWHMRSQMRSSSPME